MRKTILLFLVLVSIFSNSWQFGKLAVKVTAIGYLLMKEYSHYLDLLRGPRADHWSRHVFSLSSSPTVRPHQISGPTFRFMDPCICFGFEIIDLTFSTLTMIQVSNFQVSTTPSTTSLPYQNK